MSFSLFTARIRRMTGGYIFSLSTLLGGGYPISGLGGGYPIPGLGRGVPHLRSGWGVPHPRSGWWGVPGVPPDQVWMVGGTWGTPSNQVWMMGVPGVPPTRSGWWGGYRGYPPTRSGLGIPRPDLDGVLPNQVWMVGGYPRYPLPPPLTRSGLDRAA